MANWVLGGRLQEAGFLAGDLKPEEWITSIVEGKTTLFVGHDPTLAQFVNSLLGEELFVGGMEKGGAALVAFDGEVSLGAGIPVDLS